MELLREGARVWGLTLDAQRLAAFETYYRELAAWNRRINLTAISDYAEVQCRHFLDSLSCLIAFPRREEPESIPDTVPLQLQARQLCIDVGSGAGFPGLPVKIMLPQVSMTLLEAAAKKTVFLRHMVETLHLDDVEVATGRAEDVAHEEAHRAKYDVVLARAVAAMPTLVEYCLPFCRVGGRVIAQKGPDVDEEVASARHAIEVLGGELWAVKTLEVPGVPGRRSLVVLRKVRETPPEYPRRVGVPSKRPLR